MVPTVGGILSPQGLLSPNLDRTGHLLLHSDVARRLPTYVKKAVRKTRINYATNRVRVLPNFLIIGSQRAGTSSLFSYLRTHPAVVPSYVKEVHYFDRNFQRGLGWYRSFFPTVAYREVVRRRTGLEPAIGEATPGYIFHPLVPERAAGLLPQVKLIVLVRNPVDRAYSSYWHRRAQGLEDLPSFEQAIAKESQRLEAEESQTLDGDDYTSSARRLHSYLTRGLYAEQLTRWFGLFPRDQFLIERSEDFFTEPAAVMKRVCDFLELPDLNLSDYRIHNSLSSGRMEPGTRRDLAEYFFPHNQRLYELIGRDLGWDA